MSDILRGWKEIEDYFRLSRYTLRKWIKLYDWPILTGSGSRQPMASKPEMLAFLKELREKMKSTEKTGYP